MQMNTVVLLPKRERATVRRHPWIFSGAIRNVSGSPQAGDTVEVRSSGGDMLGYGSWSPASQIRVRMLSFGPGEPPDGEFVAAKVKESVSRRDALLLDPGTAGCRLVNAESDGLPGVVADFYGGTVVVQLASAGAERWKDAIAESLMENVPGCRGVYERSDVAARKREGLEERTGSLAGKSPPDLIEIHEGSMRFLVDVRRGHKTGFYLDQRDARAAVGAHAKGMEVLNCFSYSGGFGISALVGGAAHVTHLDVSADALALARRNTELNGLNGADSDFVEVDVFKQLRLYRDQGRKFDMVVLDPPKFADSKAAVMRAARGYKDINLLAMKLLRPGGVLATFSCSGAMDSQLFDKICADAAIDAKREFQIVSRTQAAADHPVALSFPEGAYLKGLVLRACV